MDTDTRTALGQAYKRWMRINNFSQQGPHDWSKAAGSEGPWNSQLSLLTQNPCKLDPKAGFWVALGRFNAAIAAQTFPSSITRTLRDKLTTAKPFCHDDGELVTANDFFGMFIGELPIPEAYAASAHTYTEEDAAAESIRLREAFRSYAQNEMLSPADAWSKVVAATDLAPRHQARLKEVLSGWGDLTTDELTEGLLVAACSVFTGT
jgi:hypothetical protein